VIVYAPYLPGECRGQQECRDYYASVFDSVASIEAEVTDYHVATNGLMGAIMSRQNLVIHMRDSTTRRISVRQSHGLRRVGDAWQSMIEMTSFPVDLKTGKPVTWIGQGAECEIEPDHDTSLSVPALTGVIRCEIRRIAKFMMEKVRISKAVHFLPSCAALLAQRTVCVQMWRARPAAGAAT
jgi:ketosteroid isomerase-like protein